MHIDLFRTVAVSLILLLSNVAWADRNNDIKVIIEEPAIGESYSGITNLRGWAVAPAGMTKYYLRVYIDGEFAFNMPQGGARADVGSVYPSYPNSDQSGFSMAFNYKNLTPGEHTIEVVGYDNNGDYNAATVTFNSERFSSDYIGDASQVNLSTATDVGLVDRHTISVTGATLENRRWDFTLKWDQASQSFNTVGILPSGSGSIGGTPPPANYEVYACLTSPEKTSSAPSITMKNGLELNNNSGQYWYTNDEHIVFKTASGRWYTIDDEMDFYRIDVTREPDSCFEYDGGQVLETQISTNSEKVLVIRGGKITVSTACRIKVGDKIGWYEPMFENGYVIDLLTADQCRVIDAVSN